MDLKKEFGILGKKFAQIFFGQVKYLWTAEVLMDR